MGQGSFEDGECPADAAKGSVSESVPPQPWLSPALREQCQQLQAQGQMFVLVLELLQAPQAGECPCLFFFLHVPES